MTSFQIPVSPSRRAAARFVSRVRRALQRAVVEESEKQGINQSKIADAIGVHRSVISRELNGRQDITLGRIAELAWAMGREIEFELVSSSVSTGSNLAITKAGAILGTTSFPPTTTFILDQFRPETRSYAKTDGYQYREMTV